MINVYYRCKYLAATKDPKIRLGNNNDLSFDIKVHNDSTINYTFDHQGKFYWLPTLDSENNLWTQFFDSTIDTKVSKKNTQKHFIITGKLPQYTKTQNLDIRENLREVESVQTIQNKNKCTHLCPNLYVVKGQPRRLSQKATRIPKAKTFYTEAPLK